MIYFIKDEKALTFDRKEEFKIFLYNELEKNFELSNPVFERLKVASTKEHFNFITKNFLDGICGFSLKTKQQTNGGGSI